MQESISSIEGQVAVVSGGAAGIGLACAERLADEGAKVAIIDRDLEAAKNAAAEIMDKGGEAIAVSGECTSETDIEEAVRQILDHWGHLEILVNCAGGFHATPSIEELDAEAWRAGIEWSLSGIFIPMRAVVPHMKSNGYGRIISIGSTSGQTGIPTSAIDYSAAKAGVAGLSRRVACELAPFGITVNTVSPGPVVTKRFADLHGDNLPNLEKIMPGGRFGKPEEIAHAVFYLSTPGAAYTNGATLDVNGGFWTG